MGGFDEAEGALRLDVVSLGEMREERGGTRMVRGGKKSGTSIFSMPWYFFARSPSNLPYAALAGRDQGGLLPEPTYEHWESVIA